jgi:mitochondrial import inner membrane translocase subunit TIM21
VQQLSVKISFKVPFQSPHNLNTPGRQRTSSLLETFTPFLHMLKQVAKLNSLNLSLTTHVRLINGILAQQVKVTPQLRRAFTSSACRLNSSQLENDKADTKTAAQQKVNNFIYHVKAGSRLLLSSWLIILAGGATLVTSYLLATELFSPSGETSTFNRVVNLIEKDEDSLKLLGYKDDEIKHGKIRLKAYGGVSPDVWTRNKPVQATKFTGKDSKEHMVMRFFVESDKTIGVVNLEAIEENFIEQELVFVSIDVKGHKHYLIGGPQLTYAQRNLNLFNSNGFLGVKWGSKRD